MAKGRLLILDSESESLRMLSIACLSAGYEVREARSCDALTQMARRWQPSLAIISAEHGSNEIMDLLRALGAGSRTAHIPALLLLESLDRRTRLQALELGAIEVLPQPVDVEELMLRIANIIWLVSV